MRTALVAALVMIGTGHLPAPASAQVLPPAIVTLTGPVTSVQGEDIELVATVLDTGLPLAGHVDFFDGDTPVCDDRPLDQHGVATCTVSGAGAGLHTYFAAYGLIASTPLPHVVRAPVTVTAEPKTITYGEPLPEPTATLSGAGAALITGEPACAIGGDPLDAGTYAGAITCTAGTLGLDGFLVDFVPGDLTIAKAPLTLTASDATMTSGQPLSGLGATLSGFVNGEVLETSGVAGVTACAGPDPLPAAPGTYPGAISCVVQSFAAVNYFVDTVVKGTLTVLPAAITGGGGASGGSAAGGSTTINTTTNHITNVVTGGGAKPVTAPAAATLSLLTKKARRAKRLKLKLRSTGRIDQLTVLLKRNGKTVARATLSTLAGAGHITFRTKRKLKKGVYSVQASWARSKKRFSIRLR